MIPGGSDWYIAGNGQLKRQFRQPGFYQGHNPQSHLYHGQPQNRGLSQPLPTGPRLHQHTLSPAPRLNQLFIPRNLASNHGNLRQEPAIIEQQPMVEQIVQAPSQSNSQTVQTQLEVVNNSSTQFSFSAPQSNINLVAGPGASDNSEAMQ